MGRGGGVAEVFKGAIIRTQMVIKYVMINLVNLF